MREIVIDTETTGLDPLGGDRVVEIGAVELVNRSVTGQTFHCYLCPERSVPADAFAVHGLSAEFLADKPLFAAVADELLAFVGDAPLVARSVQEFAHSLTSRIPPCNLAGIGSYKFQQPNLRHRQRKVEIVITDQRLSIDIHLKMIMR
jgi:DNA polymerase III subunit epsilon